MSGRQIVLIGCLALLAIGLVIAGVLGYLLANLVEDPKGLKVTLDSPDFVSVGKAFDLNIKVENTRDQRALQVTSIDIADDFLGAFLVVSATPQILSSEDVFLDNSRSFTFEIDIPPGESRTFTFNLRPLEAGLHRGDVDVCEGMKFLTVMAQVYVNPEDGTSTEPAELIE